MFKHLWLRIVGSLLLFVVAGTIGLVCVLNSAYERLSLTEFVALAKANAEFIHTSHLPKTDRLAQYLSRMLGVEVVFRKAEAADGRHEAVTVPIEAGADLTLIRERPTLMTVLARPVTLGALGAFWLAWFLLAWAIVRPYLKAQRLALLGQMTTGLAHEIQNPVSAIRLHAQLLAPAQPESAALIVDEATKIESLVNQWMFLVRPESPRKAPVKLDELLERTVKLLTPAAEHARVNMVVKSEGESTCEADARRLGQVFHNIMLNAIQAMPAGGTLSITLRAHTIEFADTGPGFSAAALARWSEMLFSEKEGGMGIGLSVAQEIVRAHGGRITVGNRAEGGAVVRIEL